MTNVKLKGTLPKDAEFNGLGKQAVEAILSEPRKPQVAIVVLQATDLNKSLANAEVQPVVRIERIELVTDAEEAGNLIGRAQALSEVRTGNTPLEVPAPVDESALDFDAPANVTEIKKGKG